MAFLIYTLGLLLSPHLVVGNFSYDGTDGPSSWGKEYKTCLGKYQSPIDIELKDVTAITFPELRFSGLENSHTAYITNNGHTVMIRSLDSELPMISGGPLNGTYVFQQLHFHWGQSDELGSEDLINNHSFSMELHAVFWKKEYGSSAAAMNYSDGLTVLGYWYQATDEPNPIFESIVSQIPEIEGVDSNATINDGSLLSRLIAPDHASPNEYFTYKGSLTTPPCLEIVQWIDFERPQPVSHKQLAAFRSIQSPDGTNLTHNYRPVQPLDDRVVYRNREIVNTVSSTSGPENTMVTSEVTPSSNAETVSKQATTATSNTGTKGSQETEITTKKVTVETVSTMEPMDYNDLDHSGQSSMWTISNTVFAAILGISIFLLRQ